MAMYAMFYSNIPGDKKRVAVAFDSQDQYYSFRDKYENYGGFKRLDSDLYGPVRENFLSYFHLGPETKIIRLRGRKLFTFLMKIFEG